MRPHCNQTNTVNPKFSVIIAYYKNLPNLALILLGLEQQVFKSFEVIVSEDDNDAATAAFIKQYNQSSTFVTKHVFQADLGFRKNKALNESLRVSDGEVIAFLDGDCVPHPYFLAQYNHLVTEGVACFGRRVFLNKAFSTNLLQTQNLSTLTLPNLIFNNDGGLKYGLYLPYEWVNVRPRTGIYGCNWAILKKHLVAINGFDEDYVLAGVGEDADVEWRLAAMGVRLRSTRNKTIVYHLYHKPNYSEADVDINWALYRQKTESGQFFCANGLQKV